MTMERKFEGEEYELYKRASDEFDKIFVDVEAKVALNILCNLIGVGTASVSETPAQLMEQLQWILSQIFKIAWDEYHLANPNGTMQ